MSIWRLSLDVKDVDAYRKALDVSEADAAALWASRSVGPLAYREFLWRRRCGGVRRNIYFDC